MPRPKCALASPPRRAPVAPSPAVETIAVNFHATSTGSAAGRFLERPETRVVEVRLPRTDSSAGRIYTLLDANPHVSFTPEHIARRMGIDVELTRQALIQLKTRGLVDGQQLKSKTKRQGVWLYRVARDLRDQIREQPFG